MAELLVATTSTGVPSGRRWRWCGQPASGAARSVTLMSDAEADGDAPGTYGEYERDAGGNGT
jgi:hypothetical protein